MPGFTEDELIETIRKILSGPLPGVVLGPGDDAALVEMGDRLGVLTADMLVEGVHFDRRCTPPSAIGHRALAVNLSDLAAMGASPRYVTLSIAAPPAVPLRFDDCGIISNPDHHPIGRRWQSSADLRDELGLGQITDSGWWLVVGGW